MQSNFLSIYLFYVIPVFIYCNHITVSYNFHKGRKNTTRKNVCQLKKAQAMNDNKRRFSE